LTFLCIKLLHYEGDDPKKDVFDKLGEEFSTQEKSVQFLAQSTMETDDLVE